MNFNTGQNAQLPNKDPVDKGEESQQQEVKSAIVSAIGVGTDMQSSEPRATSSKTNKSVQRRRYDQTRSIIPRSAKTKAKVIIQKIARGLELKPEPQLKILHSSSRRRTARSEAVLRRRRVRMSRSTDSFITSGKCPRCGHASCNWYPNNK